MASGGDARSTIFRCEFRERPNRVELRLDRSRQVLSPCEAIAMKQLTALTRQQANHLREMQQDAVGLPAEERAGRVEHRCVHHDLATRRGTSDERTDASGLSAGEVVPSVSAHLEVRTELVERASDQRVRDQLTNDACAVLVECGDDGFGWCVAGKRLEGVHRRLRVGAADDTRAWS